MFYLKINTLSPFIVYSKCNHEYEKIPKEIESKDKNFLA